MLFEINMKDIFYYTDNCRAKNCIKIKKKENNVPNTTIKIDFSFRALALKLTKNVSLST